jgi:hypothetical protein
MIELHGEARIGALKLALREANGVRDLELVPYLILAGSKSVTKCP